MSGRASEASLATPLKALPASPAGPSLINRAPVCAESLERVKEGAA
jgi:hypothetical protein